MTSQPTLKSPQRLERLSKYPTIAKDYDEYKKGALDAPRVALSIHRSNGLPFDEHHTTADIVSCC